MYILLKYLLFNKNILNKLKYKNEYNIYYLNKKNKKLVK